MAEAQGRPFELSDPYEIDKLRNERDRIGRLYEEEKLRAEKLTEERDKLKARNEALERVAVAVREFVPTCETCAGRGRCSPVGEAMQSCPTCGPTRAALAAVEENRG